MANPFDKDMEKVEKDLQESERLAKDIAMALGRGNIEENEREINELSRRIDDVFGDGDHSHATCTAALAATIAQYSIQSDMGCHYRIYIGAVTIIALNMARQFAQQRQDEQVEKEQEDSE